MNENQGIITFQDLVDNKEEWIGGMLEDLGDSIDRGLQLGKTKTKIRDIVLEPNGESKSFGIKGESFTCAFGVKYGSISGKTDYAVRFSGYMNQCFIITKPEEVTSNTLQELKIIHEKWLKEVGWWDKHTPLEQLALIGSEVGEAVNECRGEKPTEKLRLELADIILRTIGMAATLDIDIEKAIQDKMKINFERGTIGRVK